MVFKSASQWQDWILQRTCGETGYHRRLLIFRSEFKSRQVYQFSSRGCHKMMWCAWKTEKANHIRSIIKWRLRQQLWFFCNWKFFRQCGWKTVNLDHIYVAPLRGAWVETTILWMLTRPQCDNGHILSATPRRGAWVETNKQAHTAKFNDFLFNRKYKTSLGFRCLQQTLSQSYVR